MSSQMRAIHIDSSLAPEGSPYTASNPAPSSSLTLSSLPLPTPSSPGELLIRVHAASLVRDSLTWPETYEHANGILGNDFAGKVLSVFDNASSSTATAAALSFKAGDQIYGMTSAARPRTWATHAVVRAAEAGRKPTRLSFAEAAGVPLSALTAWQALFVHARLDAGGLAEGKKGTEGEAGGKGEVLITGANGAVGVFLVQMANMAGCEVVAATRSRERDGEFLRELGARKVVEYAELDGEDHEGRYVALIDMVGGKVLERAWKLVRKGGALVAIASESYDFVEEHKKKGVAKDGLDVAKFFIVEPDSEGLEAVTKMVDAGLLTTFAPIEFPLESAREAYDACQAGNVGANARRGKFVLTM